MDKYQAIFREMVDSFESRDELRAWALEHAIEDDDYVVMREFQHVCNDIANNHTIACPPMTGDAAECGFGNFVIQCVEDWETSPIPSITTVRDERGTPTDLCSTDCSNIPSPYTTEPSHEKSCSITEEEATQLTTLCIADGEWCHSPSTNVSTPSPIRSRCVYDDKEMDELASPCIADGDWSCSDGEGGEEDVESTTPCITDGDWCGSPSQPKRIRLAEIDELSTICVADGEWDGNQCPPKQQEPIIVPSQRKGKGLPCRHCGCVFKKMAALRQHWSVCTQHPSTKELSGPLNGSGDLDEPSTSGLNRAVISSLYSDPNTLDNFYIRPIVPSPVQRGEGRRPSTPEMESRPSEPPYTFRKRNSKIIKKHGTEDTTYEIKFNDQWSGQSLRQLHENLHIMFETVLREATGHLENTDLGKVLIFHRSLNGAIVVPLQPLSELNADVILGHIENVLNSHEDLALDSSFHIQIGTIRIPGGGHSKKTLTQLTGPNNSIKLKRSLIEIVNDDDLCMSRAIAAAFCKGVQVTTEEWNRLIAQTEGSTVDQILYHKKCPKWFYNQVMTKSRSEQKKLAIALCERADVPTDRPGNLNDLPALEAVLGCQILVISAELGNKFIRVGNQDLNLPRLFLYMIEQPRPHFHAITSIIGFFSASDFCNTCLKPFNNRNKHSCANACNVCCGKICHETLNTVLCVDCNMTCRSQACFDRHKIDRINAKNGTKMPSKCESFWKCPTCKKTLCRNERDPEAHRCGEWPCPCCDEFVDQGHLCYQTPRSNEKVNTRFIIYDFETRQDERMECEEGYSPRGSCGICLENDCSHRTRCINCEQSWCGMNQHIPNYVVAQSACESCKHNEVKGDSKCHDCGSRCLRCSKRDKKIKKFVQPPCEDTCGYRQIIFEGDGAHIKFSRWLFNENHENVTAIAHNSKAFDAYFLLEYMIDQSMYPSKIIYNGSKIMYMQVDKVLNIRVIDSLNFFPMKLSALPKAFGLTELKKGYFPHYFNIRENQNYRGLIPTPNFYGSDFMGSKERAEFLEWHGKQKGIFDFREEMKAYCISDVSVLREACLKFQKLMIDATGEEDEGGKKAGGIDPFAESITIASLCMTIFRTKFLKKHEHVKLSGDQVLRGWMTVQANDDGSREIKVKENWISEEDLRDRGITIEKVETVPSPIAQVPSQGYVQRDQYSRVSIQWLMWIQHRNPTKYKIQHALKDGEHTVPGTKLRLDGFCPKTGTAFEFQGCIWHGCPKCFPHERSSTIQPRTKQSIEELYALTCRKRQVLKSFGYKVIEIWEHEFHDNLKTDDNLKTFVDTLNLQERLEPRDSFFGGRTNASTLHYKIKEGEKIRYVDFTSLYPWVNKYCQYPIGHSEIIHENFASLDQYFGVAKVKVIPPRGLYHPVLHYRSNGKLKFPLCRTCADDEQQTPCQHLPDERSIVGTWFTPEILKAVEKGYDVVKIYEIYHWSETSQYNPETKTGGLFAGYINGFLKLKQEASDWPVWCKNEQDKSKYLDDYEAKEGILLDYDRIEKKPGLRSLAELSLNSFWGKYGQKLNMKQSKFIHETEAEAFFQMLTDPSKEIVDFHILTSKILQLEYNHKHDFVPEDLKTNIFLATFTTSWARLKLYSVLDKVGRDVLYYDTDSVIYVSKHGSYDPPLGDYLGELTDELEDGTHIVEYISGGAKNYAYRTSNDQEVCKVRGFSLNYTNSQLINFETIRDTVLAPTRDGTIVLTNPSKISREKRKRKIYNRKEEKTYRMVYTKRVIQPNLDTLPYGY